MKKIINKLLPLLLLVFITNCAGYEPIFNSQNLKFKITKYSIEGDKLLGKKIYSKLINLTKKSSQDDRGITLLLNITKDNQTANKSSAGNILEYKIVLNTKIAMKDSITDKEIINENYNYSLNYKVQDQYSETTKLENKAIDDLIDKTYQEIISKLSQNILQQ
tara:strand:- start:87 stop:575 length:489 start_codon:yes stop_codon:yes gene_type:complete